MTKLQNARFQRGSGKFVCNQCKRTTRATGQGNEDLGLCYECFEIASWENTLADNEPNTEEYAVAAKEIARLTLVCREKGGAL